MVGNMVISGCQNRPVSHVTLFRPVLKIDNDLPHWMSQLPNLLAQTLSIRLSEQPSLSLRDARKVKITASTTPNNKLNQFDYTNLTSGRVVMPTGDLQ